MDKILVHLPFYGISTALYFNKQVVYMVMSVVTQQAYKSVFIHLYITHS